MVWFYVDAENGATLDLQLRAVKGEDTGFFSSKNAGVKYYYQDEHGNVPVTLADDNNDWGHISLTEGYEGWVGVELANFACGSGHLTDQNLSSYLGNVTGVGFYAEKTFLVRDIRVTGVAKGLEDLNEPVVPADVSPRTPSRWRISPICPKTGCLLSRTASAVCWATVWLRRGIWPYP